eukprot:tig00000492_g1502.t1
MGDAQGRSALLGLAATNGVGEDFLRPAAWPSVDAPMQPLPELVPGAMDRQAYYEGLRARDRAHRLHAEAGLAAKSAGDELMRMYFEQQLADHAWALKSLQLAHPIDVFVREAYAPIISGLEGLIKAASPLPPRPPRPPRARRCVSQ